jgi:hypothetical protein
MTLDFKYEKEEYVDSRRKFLFMRGMVTKPQLFITFLLLVSELILISIERITIFSEALGIVLILSICMLFILYIYQPGVLFNKTSKFHQAYHLEFLADKIIFKTNDIYSELQWNTYSGLWENEKYYYLMQTKDIYTLIPKRVFLSKGQCEQFKELFQISNKSAEHKFFR